MAIRQMTEEPLGDGLRIIGVEVSEPAEPKVKEMRYELECSVCDTLDGPMTREEVDAEAREHVHGPAE